MADTVSVDVVQANNARRYVVHLTSQSDGTGESDGDPTTGVQKIDVSSLTNANGEVASYLTIDRIEYSVFGMNYVTLLFDATTNDELAVLKGQGLMDWSLEGGLTDPQSAGSTGDILLATDGAADGGGYDITIWTRPKAA